MKATVREVFFKYPSLFLFGLALLLFLLGNGSHSLWDRDEARFSEATREMLQSGDWIIPHLNGEIRYDKPILIYWLMAGPMWLFGPVAFAVRLPSATAGAVSAVLIFQLGRRLGWGSQGALLSTGIWTVSLLILVISKAATTDSVLSLTVIAAFLTAWEQRVKGFSPWRHFLFWAVLALSALTKGPPGIAVVALGLITERTWKHLSEKGGKEKPRFRQWLKPISRFFWGLVVFLLIGLPWAIAAWKRTDGGFFQVAVGHHVIERSQEAFEGHSGPFFYYLGLLPLLVFPFFCPVLLGFIQAVRHRRQDSYRFLLSWAIPGLILFSLVETKLPHYVAPLLPVFALMAGGWWNDFARPGAGSSAVIHPAWWRVGAGIQVLTGAAFLIGIPVVLYFHDLPVKVLIWGSLFSTVTGVAVLWGGIHWWREKAGPALKRWFLGWTVGIVILLFGLLPAADSLRPSPAIGRWFRENAPPGVHLMAVRYKEPSLMFYCRSMMEELGSRNWMETAIPHLEDTSSPDALVIPEDDWRQYKEQRQAPMPESIQVRHKGSYFIFEEGRWQTLLLVADW